MKNAVIVLAGGRGSRMGSTIKKQYLLIEGKPVLYYSLRVFQDCPQISDIVLVCGEGEEQQCREEFVDHYGISKISRIVAGGKERYHSVYEGLKAINECRFVLIHDGARPFVDKEILDRIFCELSGGCGCVAGMPVKDTIKMSDEKGFVQQTLPREKIWTIQTPQAFPYDFIRSAYETLLQNEPTDRVITDDAMVAEYIGGMRIKLVEGSYENIKITTPDDLLMAEMILKRRGM